MLLIIDRAIGDQFGARAWLSRCANLVDQLGCCARINGVTRLLHTHRDGIVALIAGPGDASQAQDGMIGTECLDPLFGFNQSRTAGTGGMDRRVGIDPALLMAFVDGSR